jgi:uncharacterized protein YciI
LAQFIYQFVAGERAGLATNPRAWSAEDEAVAAAHLAYLQQGLADGVVVLAGRAQDGIGPAIVIIEAESVEAAEAFMMSDPFISNGLFRANLHPYRVALSRLVSP